MIATRPSMLTWNAVWAADWSIALKPLALCVAVVVALWCIAAIARIGQGGPLFPGIGFDTSLVRRKRFLTAVESETLTHIETLFPHLRIYAQVAMSALIAPARDLPGKQKLWTHRRYGQKVVDFVLQDRATGHVEVLVELDDWTHNVFKDRLRDRITAAGGYPTVRLPANMRPTRRSVEAALFPFVGREAARARIGGPI